MRPIRLRQSCCMAWQRALGTGWERTWGMSELARASISASGRPTQNDWESSVATRNPAYSWSPWSSASVDGVAELA